VPRVRDTRDDLSGARHGDGAGAESGDTRGRGRVAGHDSGVDRRLAELAARQHGVVTREDARRAGLTDDAIRHRRATGRLHPLYRGVYAVGHPEVTPHGRALAAVLTCGPGAALSHLDAAALWELLCASSGPVHVSRSGSHRRSPAGVVLHRVRALEATTRHGILVTTPARTLLDVADAHPGDLSRALEEARIRRLVGPAELLARASHGRGTAQLRQLLAQEPSLTRSEAERRLLALVAAARLPVPRTNVRVGRHEVDALWAAQRLVVEVDGYAFHSSRAAFERDRLRDAELQALGYRVMRVTWRQLTREREALAARLAVAIVAPR
jgi:very-short-patch-repair endonuclease